MKCYWLFSIKKKDVILINKIIDIYILNMESYKIRPNQKRSIPSFPTDEEVSKIKKGYKPLLTKPLLDILKNKFKIAKDSIEKTKSRVDEGYFGVVNKYTTLKLQMINTLRNLDTTTLMGRPLAMKFAIACDKMIGIDVGGEPVFEELCEMIRKFMLIPEIQVMIDKHTGPVIQARDLSSLLKIEDFKNLVKDTFLFFLFINKINED